MLFTQGGFSLLLPHLERMEVFFIWWAGGELAVSISTWWVDLADGSSAIWFEVNVLKELVREGPKAPGWGSSRNVEM